MVSSDSTAAPRCDFLVSFSALICWEFFLIIYHSWVIKKYGRVEKNCWLMKAHWEICKITKRTIITWFKLQYYYWTWMIALFAIQIYLSSVCNLRELKCKVRKKEREEICWLRYCSVSGTLTKKQRTDGTSQSLRLLKLFLNTLKSWDFLFFFSFRENRKWKQKRLQIKIDLNRSQMEV